MGRLLLVLMFALSACHSGWDKDPFNGQEDRIKNAQKPNVKTKRYPPPAQGSLSINTQSVYSVREGETLEIPVAYKKLHKEVSVTSIQIKNLEEKFPGATYDKQNEKIIITPGYDFVPVDLDYVVAPLAISILSKYDGKEMEIQKTIAVHVIPENTLVPEIVELKVDDVEIKLFQTAKIKIGKAHEVKITVKDVNDEYSPRLRVFDSLDSVTYISQFFDANTEGTYDEVNNSWTFKFRIFIPKEVYLSRAGRPGTFDMYAYSINGIPSRGKTYRYKLYGDEKPPVVVAEKEIYFRVGESTDYTFSVYDPLERGELKASCEDRPKGLLCTCRKGFGKLKGIFYCTLEWKPDASVEGKHKMKFVGVNEIDIGGPGKAKVREELEVELIVRGVK